MHSSPLLGGLTVQPVELVLRQECHFKAKVCKICGLAKTNPVHQKKRREDGTGHAYARTLGCAKCERLKKDRAHLELAASFNQLGSGRTGGGHVYDAQKAALEEVLTEELEASGLPRKLDSVVVECHLTFGDTKGRDEGNIRFFIEKALGDALVTGGWLPNDTFYPVRRYTFGGIEPSYDQTIVTELRLMIFPRAAWASGGDGLPRGSDGLDVVSAIDGQVAGGDAEHHAVGDVPRAEQLA